MSAVGSRQRACLSSTWTSVVLLALCSAAHTRVIPAGHANEIGPAYQVVADNDISQDANTLLGEPGDLSLVSDKLSVFQDSNGDYYAIDGVNLESDNADGVLDSTYSVDLMSQGSDNVAKEQELVYSYPYVFFRKMGVEKKLAGDEDAIVKDGNSYILYGNYNEDTEPNGKRQSPTVIFHAVSDNTEGETIISDLLNDFFKSLTGTPYEQPTPAKRSDVNHASSALKLALDLGKELLTNVNEMHKNIDSSSRVSTNSGTFLNGLFREHRSPGGENWNPWGWKSASEPSDAVTNIESLLSSMISEMVQGAMGRKPTRTSSMQSWWPLNAQKVPVSGAQTSEGLISPERMWLITLM